MVDGTLNESLRFVMLIDYEEGAGRMTGVSGGGNEHYLFITDGRGGGRGREK